MLPSQKQPHKCVDCGRCYQHEKSLQKHRSDEHITQKRKSARHREGGRVYNPFATSPSIEQAAKNKFTVAQASRNSADRRKRKKETDKKKKLNDRLLVQIPNDRVILIQLLLNFVQHLQLLLKKNMKIYLLVQIPNDRSYSMMSILIFLVKTSVRALMGGGDVVAEHIITTVLSQRNGVFGTSQ